jgi:hypothetical protein
MLSEMKGRRQLDLGPIGPQQGVLRQEDYGIEEWSLENRISGSLSKTVGTSEARAGRGFGRSLRLTVTNEGRPHQVQVEKVQQSPKIREMMT